MRVGRAVAVWDVFVCLEGVVVVRWRWFGGKQTKKTPEEQKPSACATQRPTEYSCRVRIAFGGSFMRVCVFCVGVFVCVSVCQCKNKTYMCNVFHIAQAAPTSRSLPSTEKSERFEPDVRRHFWPHLNCPPNPPINDYCAMCSPDSIAVIDRISFEQL